MVSQDIIDYIEYYNEGKGFSALLNTSNYIYRGLSDESHELWPSILYDNNEHYLEKEDLLYKKIIEDSKKLKKECAVVLEVLRHYGLPLRILDFTSNINVALFFACSGNPETDGKLVVFDLIKYQKDHPGIIKGEIAQNNRFLDLLLEHVSAGEERPPNTIYDENHCATEIETKFPIVIKPEHFEQRANHQSGLFMYWQDLTSVEEINKELNKYIKEFLVCSSDKEQILEILNIHGFNKETLLPSNPDKIAKDFEAAFGLSVSKYIESLEDYINQKNESK